MIDFSDYLDSHSFDDRWEKLNDDDFEFSKEWEHEGAFESLSVPNGFSFAEYQSALSGELSSRFIGSGEDELALELSFGTRWDHLQLTTEVDQQFQYRSGCDGDYELVVSEPVAVVMSLSVELEDVAVAGGALAEVELSINIDGEERNERTELQREVMGSGFKFFNLSTYRYFELEPGIYRLSVRGRVDVSGSATEGLMVSEGSAEMKFVLLAQSLSAPELTITLSMEAGSVADQFVFDLSHLRLNQYYELQGSEDLSFSNPRVFDTIKRKELFPRIEVDTSTLGPQYFFRLVESL